MTPLAAPGWPRCDTRAFHGIAGEIVRLLDPETEADPVGLLVALLTFAGASIGRGPHAVADSAEHPPLLFSVLVGSTSAGRKGTVSANVKRVMRLADPRFMSDRVLGGFGSGEVLVDAVRDPTDDDEGAVDKRLLVHEAEYARVLRVANRPESTLSTTIRQAWDGGKLEARSRQRTSVASGASVAMLGHITPEELRRHLVESEIAAGSGNRNLFACVGRSKLLPEGGHVDEARLHEVAGRLATAIAQARKVGRVWRTPAARAHWEPLYGELVEQADRPGIVGALIARNTAQVLRLSVIYALLDGRNEIDVEHIDAALALWEYCAASVEYVFGDALGNAIADRILEAAQRAALNDAGIDGTQIRDLFGRHASGDEIETAIELLKRLGKVEVVKVATGGRPRNVVFALATEATEATQAVDKVA